ncbi:HupE/UreJ family protein [Paracoccaceae bacterium GXU_MW_L88]
MRYLPVFLLIASPALAHTGAHYSGFMAGLMHPLTGADHLLAILAIGLWAGLSGARRSYPAVFVGAMLTGALLAMNGVVLPQIEPIILASVIVFGAAAGLALRIPHLIAFPVIAVAGLAHGAAHGMEGFGGSFIAGFLVATAGLLAAGIAVTHPRMARIGGGIAALGGAAIAAGVA